MRVAVAAACIATRSVHAGEWQLDAGDDALTATHGPSGVVWRSTYFRAATSQRTHKARNGGWENKARPRMWSGLAVSCAEDLAPGLLVHGVVDGRNWTLEVVPAALGGGLEVGLDVWPRGYQDPKAKEQGNDGAVTEIYQYESTDVWLDWDVVDNAKAAPEDQEHLVGGGEQYSTVDLAGQKFQIWSGEQGIGRGRAPITMILNSVGNLAGGRRDTTYTAVPLVLSNKGYAVVGLNHQYAELDFTAKGTGSLLVSFEDRRDKGPVRLEARLFAAATPKALLGLVTTVTGRQPAPPAWVDRGIVVGAEGGAPAVEAKVRALLAAKVPVAGVWIQDWSGVHNGAFSEKMVVWNWKLDETWYPLEFFDTMAGLGIKVLTYINPFLANSTSGKPGDTSLFQEAQAKGYLVKAVNSTEPYVQAAIQGKFGTVDLFNPDAWRWYSENVIRCNVMLACNEDGTPRPPKVHGWMQDYGEYFPLVGGPPGDASEPDPSMPDGYDPSLHATDVHNRFSVLEAAAARHAINGDPNVTFFVRSGSLQQPGQALMLWHGDQLTTYDACDGMQSAAIAAMTSGFSGWAATHSDVGGYTEIQFGQIRGVVFTRPPELLHRWLEMSAFSAAMFRSHPGSIPAVAAQIWDPDVVGHVGLFTRLFSGLGPYRRALLEQHGHDGLPLVRHGSLVFPQDVSWYNQTKKWTLLEHCGEGYEIGLLQFFLGDELLVAPTFQALAAAREVYFPQGQWKHFWSDEVVAGPHLQPVATPLGQPAVYYLANGTWASFFANLSAEFRPGAETVLV